MTHGDCGALIRALREQALITQTELAEALLREPAEVTAIEMGDLPVTKADVKALARVFDLELASAEALGEHGHPETRQAA